MECLALMEAGVGDAAKRCANAWALQGTTQPPSHPPAHVT